MKALDVFAKCELGAWTPELAELMRGATGRLREWMEQLGQEVNGEAAFLLQRLEARAVFSFTEVIEIFNRSREARVWAGYHLDFCGYDANERVLFFSLEGDDLMVLPTDEHSDKDPDDDEELTEFVWAAEMLETPEQFRIFLLVTVNGEETAPATLIVPTDVVDWGPFEGYLLTPAAQAKLVEVRTAHQTLVQ